MQLPPRSTLSIVGLIGVLALAMALGNPVNAQDTESVGTTHYTEDAVSAQGRLQYARDNIEGKFGVRFMSHARVCDTVVEGEMQCYARVSVDNTGSPMAATTPPPAGLSPAQLLAAYGLSGKAAGTVGPIIAIVDALDAPTINSDLHTYNSTFGLPQLPNCNDAIKSATAPCFQKLNQRGVAGKYPSTSSSWALETSLDVETAHAVCQNCRILLIEADNSISTNLGLAVDQAVAQGATIVSNSYGSTESSTETTNDVHYTKSGVVFIFSSGDHGYSVSYPAASPYVVAVGGTSLFISTTTGAYISESTWSGAGSGCSLYEAKPSWQKDTGCAKRTVADVSAVADPNTGMAIYDSTLYNNKKGWFKVGGTSLAAPIIAAVYALSGNIGTTPASLPYTLTSSTTLHDIVSGSNGSCGGSYLCTALAGYDGPTGLGTPKGFGAF